MVPDMWCMTLLVLPSAPETCRLYNTCLSCVLLGSPDIRYSEMACVSSLFLEILEILYFLHHNC